MRVLRAGLAAFLLLIVLVPAALAQGPLELTTAYPSVVADPGGTATFPTTVITDTPQRVDLAVVQQPDGWSTRLRGAGSTIAAVTTAADAEQDGRIQATFTAEVDVPVSVSTPTNQVIIEARSAAGTTVRLTLDVTVQANQPGAVALETDFPELKGPTSTNFRYNLTLRNDTNQQVTFGLEADSPAGWTVDARPSGETQAATAVVDAGDNAQIQVTAKAPADTPAGKYNIIVRAVGGPETVEAPLSVEITGTFDMSLDTTDGRLNARVQAGSTSTLNLVVSNEGTTPLTEVSLSATPPQNWQVTFEPATIESIPALGNQPVIAHITAANNALAGDYLLTISARSSEATANDSVEIRTTVETSPVGYLIGIGILVVVAVGLFFVFQRYGRR